MLIRFKVENYRTFRNEIELSLKADMHIKKFAANTVSINKQYVLKTSSVYGPNNTGKTCLIEAIDSLRRVMLNEPAIHFYNAFYDNKITKFETDYEIDGSFYRYLVSYDSFNKKYIYEKLEKLIFNENNTFTREKVFVRNDNKIDIELEKINKLPTSLFNNNIPLFMMFSLKGTKLEKVQNDYISFAQSIILIKMESGLSINKTLELIQNDKKAADFIVNFAKNCDLNIEDFGYSNNIISDVDISGEVFRLEERNINKEILKIWSKHHNHIVPSFIFDSIGTRKIVVLAGYIYDAIVNKKILLIDELDSSLHHIIIRAIIALFNNDLNKKSQLIFTTHDALTMDLRRLFRKDQIYLTDITDNGENVLIHLSSEFTSRDDNGIRGDEDIVDYYLKGRFGGIPTPDLFGSMYEVLNDEQEENTDIS